MSLSNQFRRQLERAICVALVEELGRAGFVPVTVWNDGEYVPQGLNRHQADDYIPEQALTVAQVVEEVFSVDVATIHFAPADNLGEWGTLGVGLVGGNGEDFIGDWHCGNASFSAAVGRVADHVEDLVRVSLAPYEACSATFEGSACRRPAVRCTESSDVKARKTTSGRTTMKNVEEAVREVLATFGEVKEAAGILAVKLPDGTLWDMTVPMQVKSTPAFSVLLREESGD